MKRLDLVQLTLIIIGIISAFFCLRLITPFLFYLFSWFSEGLKGGYFLEVFIENIIQIATYLLFSIYTIKNSKQLAGWISNRANLQSDINFALNKNELLYAVFLGLGVFGIISELPSPLSDLYHYIKNNNSLATDPGFKNPQLDFIIVNFIKVFLFVILMVYAKVFADYFSSRINNTEPDDEFGSQIN